MQARDESLVQCVVERGGVHARVHVPALQRHRGGLGPRVTGGGVSGHRRRVPIGCGEVRDVLEQRANFADGGSHGPVGSDWGGGREEMNKACQINVGNVDNPHRWDQLPWPFPSDFGAS